MSYLFFLERKRVMWLLMKQVDTESIVQKCKFNYASEAGCDMMSIFNHAAIMASNYQSKYATVVKDMVTGRIVRV